MISKRSGNGKFPLVLLHGWGVNSAVWDFVLANLELSFDVHRIDLPGFGDNHQQLPEEYNLDTIAEQVASLCPNGCVIAGWSLGGLVGAKIALNYPQKVHSLCLIASSPCFVEQAQWKGIKADILQTFSDQLSDDPEKTVARFLAIQAMGSRSVRNDVKALKQTLFEHPIPHGTALAEGLAILQNSDLRTELQQLTIPVRGIFGRLDTLVSIESIAQWARSMTDFDYKVVDKASHAPFISHQDEFVALLYEMYEGNIGSI